MARRDDYSLDLDEEILVESQGSGINPRAATSAAVAKINALPLTYGEMDEIRAWIKSLGVDFKETPLHPRQYHKICSACKYMFGLDAAFNFLDKILPAFSEDRDGVDIYERLEEISQPNPYGISALLSVVRDYCRENKIPFEPFDMSSFFKQRAERYRALCRLKERG